MCFFGVDGVGEAGVEVVLWEKNGGLRSGFSLESMSKSVSISDAFYEFYELKDLKPWKQGCHNFTWGIFSAREAFDFHFGSRARYFPCGPPLGEKEALRNTTRRHAKRNDL